MSAVPWALGLVACAHAPPVSHEGKGQFPLPADAWLSQSAQLQNSTAAAGPQGSIELSMQHARAGIAIPAGALGMTPDDLSRIERIRVSVQNGNTPIRISLAAVGQSGRLVTTRGLGAGGTAELVIELFDLPLANAPEAPFFLKSLTLDTQAPGGIPRSLRIERTSIDRAEVALTGPRIDSFGQRLSKSWPGKVRNASDLKAERTREQEIWTKWTPMRDRNDFGAWTRGETWQESGFFGIDRDGAGRHWFVDPTGRAFWSMGAIAVGTDVNPARVNQREFLFQALPRKGTPEFQDAALDIDGSQGVGFYRWNALRKWDSLSAWRDRTLARFDQWGLNTIGAPTLDSAMLTQKRITHVRFAQTVVGSPAARTPTGFPDVFDPRWAAWVEATLANLTAATQKNPWVLGYMVDDSLPWTKLRLLDLPQGTPLRTHWLAALKARHGSVEQLARAWNTAPITWEAARDALGSTLPPGAKTDGLALEAAATKIYFETIGAILKKHDPNHLYFGCRFASGSASEPTIRAAGAVADLVVVQPGGTTTDRRTLEQLHHWAGDKPILIGGHSLELASDQHPVGTEAALPPAERQAAYVRILTDLLQTPFVVGAHWDAYSDGSASAAAEDRSQGLVDITDRPHDDLISGIRVVAAQLYDLHNSSR